VVTDVAISNAPGYPGATALFLPDEDKVMLINRTRAARALLALAVLLGSTVACAASGITPAPQVVPGQPLPMYIPQGGG
jgi:hypothetical protein